MSTRHTGAILGGILALTLGGGVAYAKPHTLGLNFTGTELLQGSNLIPPDTMGAVGPNHIVELINGRYRAYDKLTGAQVANRSLNGFWASAGAGPTGDSFDPRVVYDPFSERFFATSVDNVRDDNHFLIAVSNTSDPLDGWAGFAIDSDSDDTRWADFPMLGYNADIVYVAAKMFAQPSQGVLSETTVLAIPKADLLNAVPTVANATLFEDVQGTTNTFPHPAVDLDNGTDPAALWSGHLSFGTDFVIRSNITGPPNTPTLAVEAAVIFSQDFTIAPDGEQPGPKKDLDNIDDRFSSALVLQEGSYWGVQAGNSGGRSAVRWFEINASDNQLLQEGLISDSDLDLLYPSIAVNEFGDMVVGFTGTSENQFPSAYAVVGETDQAGNTAFDNLILLQAGVDDYERLDSQNRNRWGDYSATVLDPSDPFRFWTFQEFVSAEDIWAIQITELLLTPSIDGDTNLDGTVSFGDFAILQNHFGDPGNWLDGDFDRNGVITFADFSILQNNFGASAAPTVVPEPASITLITLVGVAMLTRHRRFA
ncbi:MAG: dockerin type I domain-containing protein [Phycisphaeraceae bacterium]